MTTVYREVPIETVEQAEALPHGTPVKVGPFLAWHQYGEGWAMTNTEDTYRDTASFLRAHSDDWPYIALVPVEATEVYDLKFSDGPFPASMTRGEAEHARVVYSNLGEGSPDLITRLVTDWTTA